MNTKLTLSIDKNIITGAKDYALSRKTSLSRMVEEYLKSVAESQNSGIKMAPITEELSSVIKNKKKINADKVIDEYLIGKYLK